MFGKTHIVPLTIRAFGLAFTIGVATPSSAQEKGGDDAAPPTRADSLAGEAAPVGRWYTFGGSASRSGASAATPIFTYRLGTAWEYRVDGEIEEEPLVWDEHVLLVSVKRKEGEEAKERTMHVLRLGDGKPLLPPRRVVSDVPLGPSLWNRTVAYREGRHALRVDQIGKTQFGRRMRYQTQGEVSPPLLFGNEVYYTQDGRFERIDIGAQQPVWSVEGGFRGRVSMLGEHVMALRFARLSEATLALVDRHSGELLVQQGSGTHVLGIDDSTDVCVSSTRDLVVARYRVGKPRTPGADADPDTTVFSRASSVGAERLRSQGSLATTLPGCVVGNMPFLFLETEDGRGEWAFFRRHRGRWSYYYLADGEHYPDIVARGVPPTMLGSTVIVGDLAFEADTLRIVWKGDVAATQRTVPARQTLLLTAGDRLLALRDVREAAVAAPASAGTHDVAKGVAVLRDGQVHRGKMRVDAPTKTVTVAGSGGRKGQTFAGDEVLWAENDGAPLLWGDPMAVVRAMGLMLEDQECKGYVSLARKAMGSNDVRAISRYMVKALELGADEKDVIAAQRQIERLRRAPTRVDSGVLAAADAAELELRSSMADLPWARAQALPADASEDLRALLAYVALELDPKHAATSAWVRGLLPAGMPVPEPFVAKQWLMFAEAVRRRPMRVVPDGAADFAWELEKLQEARATWRKDLMAVCSERVCVLAPSEVAGAVGMCVATGELVLDALESMFAGIGTSRAGDKRLLVKLYGSRDEYIERAAQEVLAFEKARKEREKAEAAKEGEDVGEGGKASEEVQDAKEAAEELLRQKRGLALTLGFFVPDEGVTRLYMPSGRQAYAEVVSTFAHELTHQWLDLRGPRFEAPANVRPRLVRPGHWIVEGFAAFVESFAWDVEAGTWDALGASMDLEMFTAAADKQRNQWSRQLTLSQVNMHRLLHKQFDMFIRRASYLGVSMLSQWNMFYAQGASTCHYLYHADDGKRRKALLEYVVNYYSGRVESLAPDTAFDMSADQLGAAVVAWMQGRAKPQAPEQGDKR
ncbi:MAG: hypothetical protein R3F56_19360 [Planctomycetota bacterium]